jgi:quercetin dioxygenase-like cupin family protein
MERTQQAAMATPAADESVRVIMQTADVRVAEYVLQPGDGLSWHHHSEVSDRFYCLDGLIGVELRDPPQTTVLRPGEAGTVPPKVVHRAVNAADGVSRYLLIQGVGRYDFVEAACGHDK